MEEELGDTVMVDEATGKQMSKGQQERLEKRLKEKEEHRKRLAAMNPTKKKAAAAANKPARPKFDRRKLNTAFMNNAKTAKDEVAGWALDFDNDAQNVAVPQTGAQSVGPKNQTITTEEEQLQQALANSLDDQSKAASQQKDAATPSTVAETEGAANVSNQATQKAGPKTD